MQLCLDQAKASFDIFGVVFVQVKGRDGHSMTIRVNTKDIVLVEGVGHNRLEFITESLHVSANQSHNAPAVDLSSQSRSQLFRPSWYSETSPKRSRIQLAEQRWRRS